MKIAENKVAVLAYTLTTDGGRKIIELIRREHPRSFIFGAGLLLEGFESRMTGLQKGDSFSFTLVPEQAYGQRDIFALIDIPKDTFEVNGVIDESVLVIGNEIPMADNHGNRHTGVVVEVNNDNVVMDFNHPLAGKELHFRGEVLEVREASQEELDSLNQGCGCGNSCGCGGHKNNHEEKDSCGCGSHEHSHATSEACPVCGNSPEDQGKGIGNCRCS